MKIKFLIIGFISLVTSVYGQTDSFQYIQGIKQEKVTFYDAERYQIFLQEFDYNMDEKGINKIKRKYSIPKETPAIEEADFPGVKILYSTDIKGASKTQWVHYLSSAKRGKIKVIGFSTICERDKNIEKKYYQAISSDILPSNIFTPLLVDTIQFAGRSIILDQLVDGWECETYSAQIWAR